MLQEIGLAILSILKIMGWMGIVLFLLSAVNIISSTVHNMVNKKENFSWKRLFQGLGKTGLFYGSSIAVAIAFTIIPFINKMVSDTFGQELISNDILQGISGIGVLVACAAVIVQQGTKAYEGIRKLGDVKGNTEEITWEVADE